MSSLPVRKWIDQLCEVACSPYAIAVICGLMGYVAYTKIRRQHVTYDDEDYQKEGHTKQPIPLKGLKLTRKQLAEYNSKRADKTYLVALHDVVYDVSSGAHDFGPGCQYASLPGTELTGYIKKQSRLKGRGYEACLNEWRMRLEDIFIPAGELIDFEDNAGEQEKDEAQDEKDLELGGQEFSSSGEETCSDGESTAFGDSPGHGNRTKVDRNATLTAAK